MKTYIQFPLSTQQSAAQFSIKSKLTPNFGSTTLQTTQKQKKTEHPQNLPPNPHKCNKRRKRKKGRGKPTCWRMLSAALSLEEIQLAMIKIHDTASWFEELKSEEKRNETMISHS